MKRIPFQAIPVAVLLCLAGAVLWRRLALQSLASLALGATTAAAGGAQTGAAAPGDIGEADQDGLGPGGRIAAQGARAVVGPPAASDSGTAAVEAVDQGINDLFGGSG